MVGGLTGVQASLSTPDSVVVEQRDIDAAFHSVFIANAVAGIAPITDVAGLGALGGTRLTFGSESSTSGKSTLLNLINATLRPTEGTVSVFDNDPALLDRRALRALRRRIATMHQGLLLAGELRVIHNVNAGRLGDWSPSRALWPLVRPQGADDARLALDRFGLGDSLWRRTDQLSGGERQRVALARLVVARPDLILADEPTASLDPTRADDVMRLRLADVIEAGFEVVPTYRSPHVTNTFYDDLDTGVARLLAVSHRTVSNPAFRKEDA